MEEAPNQSKDGPARRGPGRPRKLDKKESGQQGIRKAWTQRGQGITPCVTERVVEELLTSQ